MMLDRGNLPLRAVIVGRHFVLNPNTPLVELVARVDAHRQASVRQLLVRLVPTLVAAGLLAAFALFGRPGSGESMAESSPLLAAASLAFLAYIVVSVIVAVASRAPSNTEHLRQVDSAMVPLLTEASHGTIWEYAAAAAEASTIEHDIAIGKYGAVATPMWHVAYARRLEASERAEALAQKAAEIVEYRRA